MAKISLANILSGFNLIKINDNFKRIEDVLNNKVLFRDNPRGEDNTLRSDIDMNGHKLYNLAAPTGDSHAARLKDVKNAIAGLSGKTANLVSFEPTYHLSSDNVQGAIEEVYKGINDRAVSVFEFMSKDEIYAVQNNIWTKVTNVSDALERASEAYTSLHLPKGVYRINRPWILKKPKASLFGEGAGATELQIADGYQASTWGGQTRTAMIWHQPVGDYDGIEGWIIGGVIKDMTLNCADGRCDGIIFNRVSQSQLVENVHIYRPVNGIDNYFGWCHTYKNVYIQGAKVVSITLGSGANGTTMVGCFLIGWNYLNDRTQIHLDVQSGAIGNSFSGGAIELCDAGIRCVGHAQIGVFGTDFEEIYYRGVECFGVFDNGVLIAAGASSTVQGCGFVGDASGGMVVADGAGLVVDACTFINNGPVPTGVDNYALYGVRPGQNMAGMPGVGISSSNCTFFGWGDDQLTGRIRKGFVRTVVMGELAAEDVSVPKKTWVPVLSGWSPVGGGPLDVSDAIFVKMGRLVTFSFQVSNRTGGGISTTQLSSYVSGLPYTPSAPSAISAISGDVKVSGAALVFTNSRVFMPTVANWSSSVVISGSYFTNE